MASVLKKVWAALCATVLVACGGGGGGGAVSSSSTLSGTAATGAPIKGGTVSLRCASGTGTTTTSTLGAWTFTLSGQALPCAVQVSGGDLPAGVTYHSLATAVGTVNITPLTDLIVANAVGSAPAAWFASPATVLSAVTSSGLDTALNRVVNQLGLGSALSGINPVTTAFQANSVDRLDKVLDTIKAALGGSTTHADLIAEALKGASFDASVGTLSTFKAALSSGLTTLLASSGSGGGGTSSGGALTCNTANYVADAVRVATQDDLTNYAGNYSGTIYSAGSSSAGTASLGASGTTVTVNGQSKTVTSICVDKVAGTYGVVMYVEFSGGKVDLFPNKTLSGSLDSATAGSGGGATGTSSTLGLHSGGFPTLTVAGLLGTYDVGIYRAPSDQTNLIGPAKLVITDSGGVRSMELQTPTGTRISRITNDSSLGAFASFGFSFANNMISGINSMNGTDPAFNMSASFSGDGLITGSAGGFSPIAFRNNIAAYNTAVPAVFGSLEGTWSGPQRALTCGQPNVTVTVTAGGKVTVVGTPNLACDQANTTVEATWDGNDDLIVPFAANGFTGYKIFLDSAKGGASTVGGGIILWVTTLDSPSGIYYAETNLTGSAGSIDVNSPTKQLVAAK